MRTIFEAITSPELQRALLPLRLFLIVFSLVLLCSIIYFLKKSTYLEHVLWDKWGDYTEWKERKKQSKQKLQKEKDKEKKPEEESKGEPEWNKAEISGQEREFVGRTARSDWERVLDKLETDVETNRKLALVDANKMLDKALNEQNKEISSEFISNAEQVKEAKARVEEILENPQARISLEKAKELIKTYEQALRELRAIG